MAINETQKEIRYLNKDYQTFRKSLMDFAKVYYPNTYADFNETSPGMMFIEMASYVGDVLSYYVDSNIKESILQYAEERDNVIRLAESMGYKYKTTFPASSEIDVYQVVPASGTNGEEIDFRFALKIDEGMIIQSERYSTIQFRTIEPIDFTSTKTQNFTATIFQVDTTGYPLFYVLKKTAKAVAGSIYETSFTFDTPQAFSTVTLPYTDVIEIIDVTDSDGNKWYEVDYLAQDTIFIDDINAEDTYPNYSSDSTYAPRVLKVKKVSNRFVTKRTLDRFTELQFGSGVSALPDSVLIPSPETVKYNLQFVSDKISSDFLNTRTYGHVPSNTTLTVRFTRGGGVQSNVPQGDLNILKSFTTRNSESDFADQTYRQMFITAKDSVGVSNAVSATGGRGEESIEEIRQNAIAYFSSQDRCVTEQDYLVKTLSLPQKYGSVSKAFVRTSLDNFSIDIYTLGYDADGHLSELGDATKNNLKTYLSNYRTLTTALNIKNAFIINIGVQFSISVQQNYNKNDALLKCINVLKEYFSIDLWQIGTPIVLIDIYNMLDRVEGVRTVSNVNIINKFSPKSANQIYSSNYYPISAATIDGIIYPSVDPSIFEIKYANTDIEGTVK